MPVKRRVAKRRFTGTAEANAWDSTFDCGRDFFEDLKGIDVQTDAYGVPDVDAAREAWHRLGRRFLATRQPDPHRVPWALETFGEPPAR